MKTYKQRKEEARAEAIETQIKIQRLAISYGEIYDLSTYFYKIGKKYGLIKEFKENGII